MISLDYLEYRFNKRRHVLVAVEQGAHYDGEGLSGFCNQFGMRPHIGGTAAGATDVAASVTPN